MDPSSMPYLQIRMRSLITMMESMQRITPIEPYLLPSDLPHPSNIRILYHPGVKGNN